MARLKGEKGRRGARPAVLRQAGPELRQSYGRGVCGLWPPAGQSPAEQALPAKRRAHSFAAAQFWRPQGAKIRAAHI